MPCNLVGDCAGCTELERVDSEVLGAAQALEIVSSRRRAVAFIQNQGHDRFILGMPVEIATLILTFDLEQNLLSDPARPLRLSAVCKGWRDLIFSTPAHWSIMTCKRDCFPWRFPTDLVEPWIKRAAGVELAVIVIWDPRKLVGSSLNPVITKPAGQDLRLLFGILKKHQAAVKLLSLKMPHTPLHLPSPAPFENFETPDIYLHLLTVPSRSPPYAQLPRLKPNKLIVEGIVGLSICGELLHHYSSSLTSCFLLEVAHLLPSTSLDPIILPHLQHFNISLISPLEGNNFFQRFRTPNLICCNIHFLRQSVTGFSDVSLHQVFDFLGGLSTTLQELSLQVQTRIPETRFVEVLSGLPQLLRLQLILGGDFLERDVLPSDDAAILRQLADPGNRSFLPRLCLLRMKIAYTPSWRIVADVFAIHSTLESPRPLQLMELAPARANVEPMDRESLERLFTLPQNSLKFSLLHEHILKTSMKAHQLFPPNDILKFYKLEAISP